MSQEASVAGLVDDLGKYREQIKFSLLGLPVGGLILGRLLMTIREQVAAWFLSIVVHAAVFLLIPPAIILAYLAFGTGINLYQDVDALLAFGPLLSGGLTLILVPQIMDLDEIPGFDRLRGLVGLVALSFGLVFVLSRTNFMIWFFVRPTLSTIFLAALGLYLLFKMFLGMMTRKGQASDLYLEP
jgi:hypothetical protein